MASSSKSPVLTLDRPPRIFCTHRMEADAGTCSLDIMLLVETVSDEQMRWMLPINVLRNYALMAARTRLVAMVDVDLLPSAGLADWLLQPGK